MNENFIANEKVDYRKVLPLGTVLETDAEGYLVGQSGNEKIITPWKEAAEDIKNTYVDKLGVLVHSVYIRGSVSRGTPIDGVSDIDTVAFVSVDPDTIDGLGEWIDEAQKQLQERHPFCTKVELGVRSLERILNGKNRVGRAMVKVNSACVYGQDLAPELPKVKPGPDMYSMVWQFDRDIHSRVEKIRAGERELDESQCRWIMKRILRAGQELVLEREQAFSRDLYPCYEMFSKYYPERESEMYRALELAINPSTDKDVVLSIAEGLGYWLGEEIERELDIPKEIIELIN